MPREALVARPLPLRSLPHATPRRASAVDASVGAKTGVNFCDKKNKLGCYVPPALAILDRQFLATLDARQISNGAAEIMKMALVKDAELFDLLERHGPALVAHKFQALPDGVGDAPPSRVLDLSIHTMLEELAPNLWEDSLERCAAAAAPPPCPQCCRLHAGRRQPARRQRHQRRLQRLAPAGGAARREALE